jgi:hypothetical protein
MVATDRFSEPRSTPSSVKMAKVDATDIWWYGMELVLQYVLGTIVVVHSEADRWTYSRVHWDFFMGIFSTSWQSNREQPSCKGSVFDQVCLALIIRYTTEILAQAPMIVYSHKTTIYLGVQTVGTNMNIKSAWLKIPFHVMTSLHTDAEASTEISPQR